jgi:phenylacetate-CoA ligase
MKMHWWKTYRLLSKMKGRLKWSREEIDNLRIHKLRDVLKIAYFHSPFYRRLYEKHGVHPDQVETISDLKLIPVLKKEDFRGADPMEIATHRVTPSESMEPDWIEDFTSGSTGHPLRIYRTWKELYHIKAKVIRAFQETGFRPYQRQVVLKSSSENLTGRHWFENFGILRKYWLSVTNYPQENLEKLMKIKPHHLHGYPSGLLAIAEVLEAEKQEFQIPVICTGAELLDQYTRRKIEEAFKAEVFDLYGCKEVGNIAWECRAHQGLHINDDAMILELLDENGKEVSDGVEGEVVATYLDGLDFPFIRYALGDRAIRLVGDCPCGVKFSRLDVITGRSDERVLLPSGEWVPGMAFYELRTIPWISAYRIIQDDLESIRLQVVPRSTPQNGELEALVASASKLMHGKVKVILEVLNELKHDESGKVRAVISHLPFEQDTNFPPKV